MGKPNPNELPASHWLYGLFDEYASTYFGGPLPRPTIIVNAMESMAAMTVNDGRIRNIWIDKASLDDADRQRASDSLLHEMIHYWLAERAAGDADSGHGARFVAKASEIGRVLGFSMPDVPAGSPFARVWPQAHRDYERTPAFNIVVWRSTILLVATNDAGDAHGQRIVDQARACLRDVGRGTSLEFLRRLQTAVPDAIVHTDETVLTNIDASMPVQFARRKIGAPH
jgi:hypothetical protein